MTEQEHEDKRIEINAQLKLFLDRMCGEFGLEAMVCMWSYIDDDGDGSHAGYKTVGSAYANVGLVRNADREGLYKSTNEYDDIKGEDY